MRALKSEFIKSIFVCELDLTHVNIEVLKEGVNTRFSVSHEDFIVMAHSMVDNVVEIDEAEITIKNIDRNIKVSAGMKYDTAKQFIYVSCRTERETIMDYKIYAPLYKYEDLVKYMVSSIMDINGEIHQVLCIGSRTNVSVQNVYNAVIYGDAEIVFAKDFVDGFKKLSKKLGVEEHLQIQIRTLNKKSVEPFMELHVDHNGFRAVV